VALVITLLMLVIITVMAVAFLLLSERETASVVALHSTTDSELAAEAGLEQAKALVLQPFLVGAGAATEVMGPDLTISAVNPLNPDTNRLTPAVLKGFVSPPVFVNTNRSGVWEPNVPLDDRFYLDLNENGRFEETGVVPDLDSAGNRLGDVAVVGDPQWYGMLQDPSRAHASDNRYIARYSYLIQPIGRSLDMNWIHNEAVDRSVAGNDGFFRNQGIGPWELNLAAFFADLNPNIWNTNQAGSLPYAYSTNWAKIATGSIGDAFADARWLLTNRITGPLLPAANGNKTYLKSLRDLFGAQGEAEAMNDYVDSYSNGPLLPWNTNLTLFPIANDFDNQMDNASGAFNPGKPWPGADSPRHFFSIRDFFDRNRFPGPNLPATVANFSNRLAKASFGLGTYDRYTYYRMLAQLGVESVAEKEDEGPSKKINLNYINVGGLSASQFVPWTTTTTNDFSRPEVSQSFVARFASAKRTGPELWMNVVMERMLREDGYNFRNDGPTFQPFQIPVYTNGSAFFTNNGRVLPLYTPRLHQMAQLAANMLEATSGQKTPRDGAYPHFPHVFRPQFKNYGNDIYIVRYVPVEDATFTTTLSASASYQWLELSSTNLPAPNTSYYDIPWIFGARKGFPNFNEFSLQTHVFLKRFLRFRKDSSGLLTQPIEQALLVGATNFCFTEFAMPYTNFYDTSQAIQSYPAGRRLIAYATNEMTVTIRMDTNVLATATIRDGYGGNAPTNNGLLVSTMLNTNGITSFSPAYVAPPNQVLGTNKQSSYVAGTHTNRWVVDVQSRLRCYVFDVDVVNSADQRLVDAFTSARMSMSLDVNKTLDQGDEPNNPRLWDTRLAASGSITNYSLPLTRGFHNQFKIITGETQLPQDNNIWNNYLGLEQASYQTRTSSIAKFNAWLNPTNTTDLVEDSPFNPSRTAVQAMDWRVNDPAVHYTILDLGDTLFSNTASNWFKPGDKRLATDNRVLDDAKATLGRTNGNFKPWGVGDFVIGKKDPMAVGPDAWEFPSQFAPGKLPNAAWLGRVHRGTPWQTVYFKADDPQMHAALPGQPPSPLDYLANWKAHAGDAYMAETYPTNDWRLLDIFTTAIHPNVTRGRLSINQTNLAAWSAVLSGVGVTTADGSDPNAPVLPRDVFIEPFSTEASLNDADGTPLTTNAGVFQLAERINIARTNFPAGQFHKLSDFLGLDVLSFGSPYLNRPFISDAAQNAKGTALFQLTDADYERLPQQIAGLVKVGEPRFVVYAWGQSLKPAERGVVQKPNDPNVYPSGPSVEPGTRLVKNYQITGERAIRAVVKVEFEQARDVNGNPIRGRPRAVIESFNIIPND